MELVAGVLQVTGNFPTGGITLLVAVFVLGIAEGGVTFIGRFL